ncbi:hypothetical protein DRN87_04380, partial [Candidatus Geothermarchaeota archaeon]
MNKIIDFIHGKAKILYALYSGPKTRLELIRETELPNTTLYKYLKELKDQGLIDSFKRPSKYGSKTYYALTPRGYYRVDPVIAIAFSFLTKRISNGLVEDIKKHDYETWLLKNFIWVDDPTGEKYDKVKKAADIIFEAIKQFKPNEELGPVLNLLMLIMLPAYFISQVLNYPSVALFVSPAIPPTWFPERVFIEKDVADKLIELGKTVYNGEYEKALTIIRRVKKHGDNEDIILTLKTTLLNIYIDYYIRKEIWRYFYNIAKDKV